MVCTIQKVLQVCMQIYTIFNDFMYYLLNLVQLLPNSPWFLSLCEYTEYDNAESHPIEKVYIHEFFVLSKSPSNIKSVMIILIIEPLKT